MKQMILYHVTKAADNSLLNRHGAPRPLVPIEILEQREISKVLFRVTGNSTSDAFASSRLEEPI